jgi:hypothetical protein
MNATREPSLHPQSTRLLPGARMSPVGLEPGFGPGMNEPRRRRRRDLALSVTGLEPMPVVLPPWELKLIERLLAERLDEKNIPERNDAPAR